MGEFPCLIQNQNVQALSPVECVASQLLLANGQNWLFVLIRYVLIVKNVIWTKPKPPSGGLAVNAATDEARQCI